MNALLIGPCLANKQHGAEVGIRDALVDLGYDVQVWDYRTKSYLIGGQEVASGSFDGTGMHNVEFRAIVCPGAGLPSEVLGSRFFKALKGPKVLWNSEPIRLPNYRSRVESQKGAYDYTFTFDESEVPLYRELGIEARWLPQAFNPNWYRPLGKEPFRELCFIGSIGGKWRNRFELLRRLNKYFSVTVGTVFDAEVVNSIFNDHKLVMNLGLYCEESGPPSSLGGFGLQQRVFEAVGAGKVCVTNAVPQGTNEVFEHGKNILFYTSHDLEEVVDYGLREHANMEANVLAIRDQHSYRSRIHQMMRLIDAL